MKAYVLRDFDTPPTLMDVPMPHPGPGEVLVRVRTSSVNPVDILIAQGGFRGIYEHDFPVTIGRDIAGEVVSVGDAASAWRPGDEVWGFVKSDRIGAGTFAEYVVVPENRCIDPLPSGIDFRQAGAAPLAGVTAIQCLDTLQLPRGASVFIHGGSGGVGVMAVQLAKASGLEVVATARPGTATQLLRELGANVVIDWTLGDTPGQVLAASGRVDGVVDLVSRDGSAMIELGAAVLPSGGAMVSTLSASRTAGTSSDLHLSDIHSAADPALVRRLGVHLDEGHVRVPIRATFALEDIDDAFAALARPGWGKVALTIGAG